MYPIARRARSEHPHPPPIGHSLRSPAEARGSSRVRRRAGERPEARLAVMAVPQAYVERTPLPSLARAVRTVWVQHTGPGLYVQRNLPTGGAEIQCRVGSVPRLVGPLTAARIELLSGGSTVVGVRFRAGAAAALLGVPADELVDQVVPLDDLWGDRAVRLGELLTSAASSSAEAAIGVLQNQLATLRAVTTRPDPLVATPVRRLMPWRRRTSVRSPGSSTSPRASSGGASCPSSVSLPRRCNARCASRATSPSPRPPQRTTAPAEAGWRTWPRLSGTPTSHTSVASASGSPGSLHGSCSAAGRTAAGPGTTIRRPTSRFSPARGAPVMRVPFKTSWAAPSSVDRCGRPGVTAGGSTTDRGRHERIVRSHARRRPVHVDVPGRVRRQRP